MKKRISILGGSGSIGSSTLRVIKAFSGQLELESLSVHTRIDCLPGIIKDFNPMRIAISSEEAYEKFPKDQYKQIDFLCGAEGLREMTSGDQVDIVVSSLVGFAGLVPTLDAIRSGKDIALANKEVLVAAGELVTSTAHDYGVSLYPVDSEINAVSQLLRHLHRDEIERVILTASGGALRDWSLEWIDTAEPCDVLKHPTWSMGDKVTVDSATMVNKGFEVIETHWFFNLPYEKIHAVIHPHSIVHGMVEMKDGTIYTHMAPNNMVYPIQNALLMNNTASAFPKLDLNHITDISFQPIEQTKYPAYDIVREAGKLGGIYPVVVNRVNERNVTNFLQKKLSFTKMAEMLALAIEKVEAKQEPLTLERIHEADQWADRIYDEIEKEVCQI